MAVLSTWFVLTLLGEIAKASHRWHTGDELTGDDLICRPLFIPDDLTLISSVGGALSELTKPYNWEQVGTMTPETASEIMTEMLKAWHEEACGDDEVPTPFWDDQTDLDDEMSPIEQIWYGNWIEGEFVENIGTFLIAGFIAYAATPAAAVFFLTIAPKFRLAWKTGDVGGIIRVFIDGADYGTVDTYSPTAGIVTKDFITDPEIEEHEVVIVLDELHEE